MTHALVTIAEMQREAAQATVMMRTVEQKLAALATRDDIRATSQLEMVDQYVNDARSNALSAASVLNGLLSSPAPAFVGDCELCNEPILATETVGAFASGLCHQECAEKAIDQADAAREAANDAYERGR